ncbi:MAG: class I poly(R)-hydroxyalkanoic acid synthase, partial [Porticoccus sp.]
EIDLTALDCDKYITAGLTDHITPWKACYKTTQFVGGNIKFVLSSSGHIQSLVNPPSNKKAKYFCNEDLTASAEDWLAGAEQFQGSWWNDWAAWLSVRSGGKKVAPKSLGCPSLKPQEAAPGTYIYG